jgi:hypothetical protein
MRVLGFMETSQLVTGGCGTGDFQMDVTTKSPIGRRGTHMFLYVQPAATF